VQGLEQYPFGQHVLMMHFWPGAQSELESQLGGPAQLIS